MMLNPNQRRALLDARYPAWVPMTLAQSLDARAMQFPERPLVITDKARILTATSRLGRVPSAQVSFPGESGLVTASR
ncbi:hypothetical protein LP417_22610 [Polaromonas sp. P1-6]|nr:hypothetical protein LP417_22610 [Polaromonas sp. P1-6]